jgi:hypothetical protein
MKKILVIIPAFNAKKTISAIGADIAPQNGIISTPGEVVNELGEKSEKADYEYL